MTARQNTARAKMLTTKLNSDIMIDIESIQIDPNMMSSTQLQEDLGKAFY